MVKRVFFSKRGLEMQKISECKNRAKRFLYPLLAGAKTAPLYFRTPEHYSEKAMEGV